MAIGTPREEAPVNWSVVVIALIVSAAIASAADAAKRHKKAIRPNAAVSARPLADPYAVYVNGEYIGRDPDPNIRAFMLRNPRIWDGPE
jgi:hypothetical protein